MPIDEGTPTVGDGIGGASGGAGDVTGDSLDTGGEVYGCTNPTSSNYNRSATVDDGSCLDVVMTPPPPDPPGVTLKDLFVIPDSSKSPPAAGATAGAPAGADVEKATRDSYKDLLDPPKTESALAKDVVIGGQGRKVINLGDGKSTGATAFVDTTDLPEALAKDLPGSIFKSDVEERGKGGSVTFLGEEEETFKSEIVSGDSGPDITGTGTGGGGGGDTDPGDGDGSTPPSGAPPGRGDTYTGRAPPPCDEPPFDYSQEPSCSPNSMAFVPDWTGLSSPFLNQSTCQYSVPVQTGDCPEGLELHPQVIGYVPEGISSLMDFLGKQSTPLAETALTAYVDESAEEPYDGSISTQAYLTDLAPGTDLKILYKWPFGLVRALRLPELTSSIADAPAETSFEIYTEGLMRKIDRLGQQLGIYAQKQVDAWADQQIKVVIAGTVQEINIGAESSQVDGFKAGLSRLLSSNDWVMSDNGNRTAGTQFEIPTTITVAEKLSLYRTQEYKLVAAYARERGADFQELGMGALQDDTGLGNSTLFAYFSRLDDILYDFEKSTPISLVDFVRKYHYPSVSITDGIGSQLPNLGLEGCADSPLESTIIDAGNSILEGLQGLISGDAIAEKFATQVCMTDEQIQKRNKELRSKAAAKEFNNLLKSELSSVLPMSDPLVQQVVTGIKNISENGPTIATAWEKLFNKMSMCGLFTLIGRTVEFIAKNDVCGITPEKALMDALTGALKNMKPADLKRVFDGIEPASLRSLIQDRYFDRITGFVEEIGSTSGLIFPWDYEERVQNQSEREEMGLLLYSADLFATPEEALPTEYSSSLATAFLQGYEHNAYTAPSGSLQEELSAAYWEGYVQRDRAAETDPYGLYPTFDVDGNAELTEEQTQTLVNNVEVTLNRQNGASVGKLVAGLAGDTLKFLIEVLVKEIIGTLQDNLTFEQILEIFQDIPVLGAILKILPKASKCVVNASLKTEDGKTLSLSQLQQNLQQRLGQIDICDLKPAKKPITLPNLEPIINARVNTLWASFQNALIEVLKEAMIAILIRTLTTIIKKAIEVILGFACAATEGTTDAFLRGVLPPELLPGGNMRDFLQGALAAGCGAENIDPDQKLAELAASLIPGLSEGDALSLLGPQSDCNFIERIQEVLTVAQLLDLIEGVADPNILPAIMHVLNQHCPDLEALLPDEASIANFFQNLGTVFPPEYIDYLRASVANTAAYGGIIELESTLCPSLPEALDNLREALNCQDSSTPEQIDAYIGQFQDRLSQTMEDMAATLGGALESNLQDSIQGALGDLVPKDEPGNMIIAEDIVSLLFDPFYSFYAKDLMNALGQGGRIDNAGVINMILANKSGVAQTGQIANFGMAVATLTGPMLAFISFLPPPASAVLSASAVQTLVTNLRLTFFGPEPEEGDLETERCNDSIPVTAGAPGGWNELYADIPEDEEIYDGDGVQLFPPTLASWQAAQHQERARCHQRNATVNAAVGGLGPYGHGPLKKPLTVAKSLQTLFVDFGSYFSVVEEQASTFFPLASSLAFQLTDRYTPAARIFDINYNFETGKFEYIPYKAFYRSEPAYTVQEPDDEWLVVESTNNQRLELELGEFFAELPVAPDTGGITPTNMGAGLLFDSVATFDANPAWSTDDTTAWLQQSRFLTQQMRSGVAQAFANSVAANQDAFDYGEYNLEILTDETVLNPSDELLDKGYNFMYLDDGRIFVEPPPKGGWLEIKDRLLPRFDETFCCPDKKELFDVPSIKERTLEAYKMADDDPRLSLNPKTVHEPPYAHILARMNLAGCEGNIMATIRVYAIEYFLQGYATYNKFPPRIPQVHSDLLAEYIAERMKRGLFDQHNEPGAPVWPPGVPPGTPILPGTSDHDPVNAEKLHAYWYEFLEQCVQTYSRRIKSGTTAVTSEVDVAMNSLQSALDSYKEPGRGELNSIRAFMTWFFLGGPLSLVLAPFAPIVLPQVTFKRYKRKIKIDILRENEAAAMIILKQLIREELNRMSDDLPDIFEAPPGGRVDDIYMDFLQNTFSIGATNIFDVPVLPLPDPPPPLPDLDRPVAAVRILDSYEDIDFDNEQFTRDQFMLESYVRGVMKDTARADFIERGSAALGDWQDDQVYPLTVVAIFVNSLVAGDDAAAEALADTPLSDIFDSFKYGLRLVYVPSPNTVTAVDAMGENSLFEKLREPLSSDNPEGLFRHPSRIMMGVGTYGEFTLPVVHSTVPEAEFEGTLRTFRDAVEAEIDSFNASTNGVFQWNDLARVMTATDEFRTMFEYASPFNTILSLLGLYNAHGFLDAIGGDDDWNLTRGLPRPYRRWNRRVFPVIKRKLKNQFNQIYNSNDFTYIHEPPSRASREEVDRLRREFSIDWPQWGDLTPPVLNRLIFSNPMCYSEETGLGGLGVGTAPAAPLTTAGDTDDSTGPTIIKDPAPEHPDVTGGLPDKDFGGMDGIDLVSGREMDLVAMGELLDNIAVEAAMDAGGYELLAQIRDGLLPGLDLDLILETGIIWGWGLPDGRPLSDRLSELGVADYDKNLVRAMDIVLVNEMFGSMDDAGIVEWGRYHSFVGSEEEEAFTETIHDVLDLAAANPDMIAAATTMLIGLASGDLSLIV